MSQAISVDDAAPVAEQGEGQLRRVLTARHLVMLGVGAVIGAGIFVVTGQAAAVHAGPALVISFVIAGIACALAALCYAEFAAMLPVSGSAYSYAYATLGEYTAWFVGWNLVLEYLFAASAVAAGWSGYFNDALRMLGRSLGVSLQFPGVLAEAPIDIVGGQFHMTGAVVNLPAVIIIGLLSSLCYRGITRSAFANAVIVALKVTVIALFVVFAAKAINIANWHPFIPPSESAGHFGWGGVFRGATIVFMSYIGFDAVSTAAGEARNPQRDMPIGILGSLAICTVLYIVVSLVLTGIAPFRLLNTAEPVATALSLHPSLAWLEDIVVVGAICGLASVILVLLLGLPRVLLAMAKDGLLPRRLGHVHVRFGTPSTGTAAVGVVAAAIAALFPIGMLSELVSMGTLLAFATVCIGVLVLRYTKPSLERGFRVPCVWVTSVGGAAACLYLFWQAFESHWQLMIAWAAIGQAIYFAYGYRHSVRRRLAQ
ncbi:amino acid permease [Luteibacter sp. SG786]|uniref:APC family permease n=1 Tax=Luteibacter sp. SG786 TaxID=2587130 RepID=UPI00141D98BA|nr:amino acid permease [Luteibacter sp. SG786]NII55603.1 APA family basic amino acid/polyamine antiporter [Luteibacter sp. SG786]